MNLHDDFLLERVSQRRANLQLAAYAIYVGTGQALWCKTVKSATIATYLRNIALLVKKFRPIDPRYAAPTDRSLAPVIKHYLDNLKKWESIPDRREPMTLEMIDDCRNAAVGTPSSSIENALVDFYITGIFAGYRISEWSQCSKSHWRIGSHRLNFKDKAYAITLADLDFRSDTNARITIEFLFLNHDYIPALCIVHFDAQKNGEHDETKKFSRNDDKPHLCFIRAKLRIIRRFITLIGWDYTLPLSVFSTLDSAPKSTPHEGKPATTTRNITSDEIEFSMRRAASNIYNLNPAKAREEKDLKLWSAHSLRVGACVLLYVNGYSDTEIKFILRWKSDAFRAYLRNLAFTARKQVQAINRSYDTMDNFL